MAVAPRPWQVAALPEIPRKRKSVRRGSRTAFKTTPTSIAPTTPLVRSRKTTTVKAFKANTRAKTKTKSQTKSQTKTKPQLKLLAMGQRFTQFLAIATIGTAVGLYACTVYNQKVWGDAYSQLDQLRDDERSYVTNNESLKQQLREQSEEPSAALEIPKPDHNVFVPEPPAVTLHPPTKPSLQPINNQAPIGY